MKEELSGRDIISLTIGSASLILAILFIKDDVTKISVSVGIMFVLISSYFVHIYNKTKSNAVGIKKINEKMDVYQRLNKIEAILNIKCDKK